MYTEQDLNLYNNKFLMSFDHAGESFVVLAVLGGDGEVLQVMLSEIITYNGDLTYSDSKSTFSDISESDKTLSQGQLFSIKIKDKFNSWIEENYGASAPTSFLDEMVEFYETSIEFKNGKLNIKQE